MGEEERAQGKAFQGGEGAECCRKCSKQEFPIRLKKPVESAHTLGIPESMPGWKELMATKKEAQAAIWKQTKYIFCVYFLLDFFINVVLSLGSLFYTWRTDSYHLINPNQS